MKKDTVSTSIIVPSTNTIIPPSYLDELMYWRDQIQASSWRIGEIVNEIFALAIANQWPIEKMTLYARVGQIVGKGARTVRGYADVAAFFPKSQREKYDVLPVSHFVYSMKYEDWETVLNKSLDYLDKWNIPPSVERLHLLVTGQNENVRMFTDFRPPVVEALPPTITTLGEPDPDPDFEKKRVVNAVYGQLRPLPDLLSRLMAIEYDPNIITVLAQAMVTVRKALEQMDSLGKYIDGGFTQHNYSEPLERIGEID